LHTLFRFNLFLFGYNSVGPVDDAAEFFDVGVAKIRKRSGGIFASAALMLM
jgi:hypothetical protein